ncbi:hypothetical protein [Polymorphobacter multimanifer]|nr:hypothetical protein [Polymorphobacter multimanifer]
MPSPQTDMQRDAARLRKRDARLKLVEDLGTPPAEQLSRGSYTTTQIIDPEDNRPRWVKRSMHTRNLERWLSRGAIEPAMYRAGDLYRSSYERAGIERSMISRYGPGGGSVSDSPSYAGTLPSNHQQMAAREHWRAARAVIQANLLPGFEAMVLHDQFANELNADHGRTGLWTLRTSIPIVCACLETLMLHYQISVDTTVQCKV